MVKNFNAIKGKWYDPVLSTAKGGNGVNLQWTPDKDMAEDLLARQATKGQIPNIQWFWQTDKLTLFMTDIQGKIDERAKANLAKRLESGKDGEEGKKAKPYPNSNPLTGLNINSDEEESDAEMEEDELTKAAITLSKAQAAYEAAEAKAEAKAKAVEEAKAKAEAESKALAEAEAKKANEEPSDMETEKIGRAHV